jgi:hypothetical protein
MVQAHYEIIPGKRRSGELREAARGAEESCGQTRIAKEKHRGYRSQELNKTAVDLLRLFNELTERTIKEAVACRQD